MSDLPPPPVSSPSEGRVRPTGLTAWRWPIIALAAVVVIVTGTVLVVRELSPRRLVETTAESSARLVRQGVDAWRRFSQAEVRSRAAEFVEGLPVSREDMSLVVTQVDLTQTLYAENTKVQWGIDLGTTKVLISVPARLHYAIDLEAERPVTFEVDSKERVLHAYFPDPQVLAVEILGENSREIVDVGWGRLGSRSGQALKDRLDSRKYETIRRKGQSAAMLAMVRDKARPVLSRFVALYLVQSGVWSESGFDRVVVHFAGDAPDFTPAPYNRQPLE